MHFNVPGAGSKCVAGGTVSVSAITDNSAILDRMAGVRYEVVLAVVSCRDLPAGQVATFKVTVGAASS